MALTAEQIAQYREEGFLILDGLLNAEKCARYCAIFEELVERSRTMTVSDGAFNLSPDAEGKPMPGQLHKVQGVCVVDERVLGLAQEPEILDCVSSLLGPNLDIFGTKFFPMTLRGATSTSWHQDNYYFGTNTDQIVSCAIYLEKTDTENGCLRVMPGSHRTGEIVEHVSGAGTYAHGDWSEVDESKAVDVVCSPGTVVLFSANLLHGARPNMSDRSSYRTAWHYLPGELHLEHFPRGVYRDRHLVLGR
jgi:ectoine hydroxylase-related dioxygenase (phytanoyl-CoA dioxygenase family)